MKIILVPFDSTKAIQLIDEYYHSNGYIIDSYYEDHILESDHYLVSLDGKSIGQISVFKPGTLVHYAINELYLSVNTAVFRQIVEIIKLEDIYVSTDNSILLNNGLEVSKTVEVQDCIYQLVPRMKDSECKNELNLATRDDISTIKDLDDGFFKNLDDNIKNHQLYIGRNSNEIFGFGIIERNRILKEYASIGMFVVKEKRGKGYGSQILKCLISKANSLGWIPMAGCLSKNQYSRNALEMSGMYSKTRLLRIKV